MRKTLIVLDMLNGFCDPRGALYSDAARGIVPFVALKIEEHLRAGSQIIFVADQHDPDDREFSRYPRHCVKGSWESEVFPEIAAKAPNAALVAKKRYGAFYNTRLDEVLNAYKPDLVEVVGVCTNICVLYTVEELVNRDYEVRVYRDGVASFDQQGHEFALKEMARVHGAEIA